MLAIVIPAYNEARQIAEVVHAARAAADAVVGPDTATEIVVVDDASTDDTAALAAAAGARVVHVEKRQIAAVRNAGARATTGDPIVFVDGDTFLNAATLRAALDALRDPRVAGGGALMVFDAAPRPARIALWITARLLALFRVTGGCFLYVRREVFDAVDGFDESLYAAEELAFARAIRRHGRFRILRRTPVTTSGRKVRRFTVRRLLADAARMGRRGRRGLEQREGLDIWYDGVRDEPERPA